MPVQLSREIAYLLVDVSLKALILGALAFLFMRCFRGLSVHAQHRVWTAVLMTWLLLPAMGLVGLSWSLPLAIWPIDRPTPLASDTASPSPAIRFEGERFAGFRDRSGSARPRNSLDAQSVGASVLPDESPRLATSYEPVATDLQQTQSLTSAAPATHIPWPSLLVMSLVVWLAGVCVMLIRLIIAIVRTRQICRNSRVVHDSSFPTGIHVYENALIASPVVVGWWKPCVLLPAHWREWTAPKREAVFSHELSHLRRGDTLVSALAELLTLLYWFHPLSWWTKRRLSQLAELACDEAAAVALGDRLAYARYLVEIAAAIPQPVRYQPGTAMARSSEISQRVRALLDVSRPLAARTSWSALAAILLLGIPTALLIAAADPTAVPKAEEGKAVVAASPVQGDAAPETLAKSVAAESTQPSADGPILTLRGTVFMPDGSVAKDAILEQSALDMGGSAALSATITEGRIEIRTPATRFNQPEILLRTPDGSFQTLLDIGGHQLRTEYANPKRVLLSPTKVIHVHVTDDKQPVASAKVQVMVGSYNFIGETDFSGVAKLSIPRDQGLFLLAAWTDDHRIGSQDVYRQLKRDPEATDFHVAISRGAPVRVRAVDQLQQPLANVPLNLYVASRGRDGLLDDEQWLSENSTSLQTTNAMGEATFAWVPDWPQRTVDVSVTSNSPWRKLKQGELKPGADGTYVLELAPSRTKERLAVEAQLAGVTTDVTGLLVELWSFQGEEEDNSDVVYARADAQGRFVARVLPGSTYCAYVNDSQLVSQIWDGMLVDWNGQMLQKPELVLSKGVPVEIVMTKGADHRPMVNASVALESPHEYTYRNRDGSKGNGSSGRRFWNRTDEHGRFTAPAAAGILNIRAMDGDWESKQTIIIVEGQPAKIHVHRKYVDKQKITGKLVLPAGVIADLSQTEIRIAGMDGESEDKVTVTSDAEGNFTAAIIAGRISILAMSPEEKYFGSGIVDVREGLIEIPTYPTVPYQGHVLGPNSEPLPGVKVRMMARLIDHLREYPPGTPEYLHQYAELFHERNVTTDAAGHFVYPTTPQRMELTLWFTRPGETESASSKTVYIEPGEKRPAQIIRIRPPKTATPRAKKPLDQGIAETIRDCRLAEIHALVVVSGPGDAVAPFVGTHITAAEEPHDSYSYYLAKINGPEGAEQPDRKEYFAAHKWPFPEHNSVFLTALDGTGQELGRLTLDLNDDQAAASEVAAFLKRHLPPQHDAQAGFEAALVEAKQSGRRLWVRVGQTRCGPCFTFSRWLDSQKELLAKDYVMFKFDDIRDTHGRELRKALKFDAHGVPCHAILDADGKELINSIGPLGNIGSPVGDFEGTDHLRKMLEATAQKLTDADIEALIRSLNEE